VINPGVTLGKGAMVGSDTVVIKDVPTYAIIIMVVPARILKY
jgi:acetyltransferase-like isoleucine patch superfamily enzyme